MEEEDLCSSLPEATNSVVCAPRHSSRTSAGHQYLNGGPDEGGEGLLMNQEQDSERIFHTEHNGTSEEADTWEQILWPCCNTAALSLASVDWDVPRSASGTPPLVTASVGANQTDSLTRAADTSFPVHSQSVNRDLLTEVEEQDEFDSWLLLCSESAWMGPNLKPSDAERTNAQRTQEEEHVTHKLLNHNSGTSLRSCLQREKHRECVEADFIHSCVEIQFAEFIEDDIEHLRLEQEPDETDILLTGQTNLEEEPTLENGDEITGTQDEEQIVTNEEATAASQEVTAEELQRDETGFSIKPEKLIDLQQLLEDLARLEKTETRQYTSQHFPEDPIVQPDMCKDVNQDVPREHSDEEDQTADSEETTEAAESTAQANYSDTRHLRKDLSGLKQDHATCNDHHLHAVSNEIQQIQENEPTPLKGTVSVDVTRTAISSHPPPCERRIDLSTTEKARTGLDEGSYGVRDATVDQDDKLNRQTIGTNGGQCKVMNGEDVDREEACRLADRLFKLDGIQRIDVVKHLDKDNTFSRAVGEEYLKYFDFSGQTLDQALRSFLGVVVLIGESQERERVLQHFSSRYHECNPGSFPSSGSVLALTCAMMLLNTDLHGQHVGKSMSSSKFVSNLDGMNEGESFNKDLLKSLYSSIKAEPLQWALDEEELKSSVLEEEAEEIAPLRSKTNPFLDVPHDKNAIIIKQGFLQRKIHADVDGKRTPWGKRRWKIFNAVLRGMVLYLQKDDYRKELQVSEEVVSVHHSLAEEATEYTKRPHVFRLQTADWRVFLFQASSNAEMALWINRINLVSALHSSPPFPAAVGSQRRFCRPILPASQSANTLDRQLQSHSGMLESFKADLSHLHENPPEGRRAKAKDQEEHRLRAEYLQHEICRYEAYIQVLEVWKKVKSSDDVALNSADLNRFDRELCAEALDEEEEGCLKKSHSSPSLELEAASPAAAKVRRNISERRTYRKVIIPR